MQCMAGAMSTLAAASGSRAWLGGRHFRWLTPRRLRRVTVTLFSAALLASSFVMSGSSAHQPAHTAPAQLQK